MVGKLGQQGFQQELLTCFVLVGQSSARKSSQDGAWARGASRTGTPSRSAKPNGSKGSSAIRSSTACSTGGRKGKSSSSKASPKEVAGMVTRAHQVQPGSTHYSSMWPCRYPPSTMVTIALRFVLHNE
jgi:hypothetical protein